MLVDAHVPLDGLAGRTPTRLAMVQHGRGATAFAKTLHLEAPWVTVAVVEVPLDRWRRGRRGPLPSWACGSSGARELLASGSLGVWLGRGAGEWPSRSDRAIEQAVGEHAEVDRRADGKPELRGRAGVHVSAAHAGALTLAVAHQGEVACDLELVAERSSQTWADLLGDERRVLATQIAERAGEDLDTAATRVWCALECMQKAGGSPMAPLTLVSTSVDGWVVMEAGGWKAVSCVAAVTGETGPLVLAVLARSDAGCERTSTGTSSASRRRTSSATSTT
jgi:hypothetical protein